LSRTRQAAFVAAAVGLSEVTAKIAHGSQSIGFLSNLASGSLTRYVMMRTVLSYETRAGLRFTNKESRSATPITLHNRNLNAMAIDWRTIYVLHTHLAMAPA
jgi:hypothetical protein